MTRDGSRSTHQQPETSGQASTEPPSEDRFATALRGFGPIGLLVLIVVVFTGNLIGALLVLAWAWRSHTPWQKLGFVPPVNWIRTVVVGILAGTAFKFVMKALVMPALGADPINTTYHYLVGNSAALPGILFTVVVGGGVGEEIIWRGYLFERLGKLLGSGSGAKAGVLSIATLLFALAHYPDQGVAGAEQAVFTGLVFGGIFMATGQLWLPMVMHAAFDVTAVLLIYLGVESKVAHWILR